MGDLTVDLRRATERDIPALLVLDRDTPTAPHWQEGEYKRFIGETFSGAVHRTLLVASTNQQIQGFAAATAIDGGVGEVESLVVGAEWRRRGVGKALCGALLGWCWGLGVSQVVLEVRAGSAGAIALYEGLGFVVTGRRAGYYRNPEEDGLLMSCSRTAGDSKVDLRRP